MANSKGSCLYHWYSLASVKVALYIVTGILDLTPPGPSASLKGRNPHREEPLGMAFPVGAVFPAGS